MYETGTATGVVDLITKLEAFISANGWTTDSLATEGSGKRLHAHRSGVYLNMRGYVAETPNAEIRVINSLASTTSIAFNIGTGYSGATAWYKQAGAPQGSDTKYMTAGMNGISGTFPAYHFFAHNSGDSIVVVLEYVAGYYQTMTFGTLNKFGTYTGGEFFTGSHNGVENAAQINNAFIPGVGFFTAHSASPNSPSFINVTVDAETGWHWSESYVYARDSTKRYIGGSLPRFQTTVAIQPNTLNSLAVDFPVVAIAERDTNHNSSTGRSPLGELPSVYLINIKTLIPAQQITLGSEDYRVFPFYHKDATASTPSALTAQNHSACYGFAVKEL